MKINITHIDTACVLLEINGYKILTDPTLDQAGQLYYHGFGAISRKTNNPAINNINLTDIDLVLLSHHQHKDNFDNKGRLFTNRASQIISTKAASSELKNTIGLDEWETKTINTQKLSNLKITATPAQHRPWWIPEYFSGKVIGFVIEYDEQENGVLYITGDTVYFKGIDEVAKRYKIDVTLIHAGAAQFRYLSGFGQYTMNSKDLIKSINVLKPRKAIPIHHKGWTHFKETDKKLIKVINQNEAIRNITVILTSGKRTEI